MMHRHSRTATARRGNAMVEVALAWVILTPLLIGSVSLGLNIGRAIQTTQVCRDACHMYVRGVDFSLTGNQDIVVRLAQGLGMTRTGGAGVVTFTKVLFVGQAECTAAGLTTAQCVNLNKAVILQRIRMGDTTLRASSFGAPPSQYLDSQGYTASSDYLTQPSLVVPAFSNLLALNQGEIAYITEAYFSSRGQSLGMSDGTYARSIF
jgi:hypothetical protein